MTRQRDPKTFSEYKAKRLEILREISYHEQQSSYHRASAKASQEQLEQLESRFELWQEKATEERSLANQESIQETNYRKMIDETVLQERANRRKAQSLYEAMIKNFK